MKTKDLISAILLAIIVTIVLVGLIWLFSLVSWILVFMLVSYGLIPLMHKAIIFYDEKDCMDLRDFFDELEEALFKDHSKIEP